MIVSLLVIALVGLIAYIHFVQGFFSATLSAILSIIAATVAVGYHEFIVRSLFKGNMPEQGHAVALVGVFALLYLVLRVLFDQLIPGNVNVPLLVDRIGAVVMGAVAGVFAVGVLIIAAQTLPWGPSILGYTRFEMAPSQTPQGLPTKKNGGEGPLDDILKSDTVEEASSTHLLLPVDDIVVNVVARISEGGALASSQSMRAVHPSYLDELFFQRLGIQSGAKRVALNLPDGEQQVTLQGLYSPIVTADKPLQQLDGEVGFMNPRWTSKTPPNKFTPDSAHVFLVARVAFSSDAQDSDGRIRLSPASVRLVANGKNHAPIGTLDTLNGMMTILRANRADDFLVVTSGGSADLVFNIPTDDLTIPVDPKNKNGPLTMPADIFMEVKRMGFIDLASKEIKREMPPIMTTAMATIMRKDRLPKPANLPAAPIAPPGPNEAPFPFDYVSVSISAELPTPINVGRHEAEGDVTFPSGAATIKENKIAILKLEPKQPYASLSQGDNVIKELWVPPGFKLVQLSGTPPSKTDNAWTWRDRIREFDITDGVGASLKPRGAWTKLKVETEDRMSAVYKAETDITSADLVGTDGRPMDVVLLFVVPDNFNVQVLRFSGRPLAAVNKVAN